MLIWKPVPWRCLWLGAITAIAAPNNGTIMLFQSFYLTLNFILRSLDRLCTFKGQLQWDFYIGLLSPR